MARIEQSPCERYTRYDIKLGSGAYKTVWKGYDAETGTEIAWNIISTRGFREHDFECTYNEIKVLTAIRHPNIIRLMTTWERPEQHEIHFITEWVTSGSLRDYIGRINEDVKPHVILQWCQQILAALDYLHSHQTPIIHRDIKCDNIFINGHDGTLKIGDFGLCAVIRGEFENSIVGTPEFMAPEIYTECYNHKADIYAFGMCVLEMVTKHFPYEECTNMVSVYRQVITGKKPAIFETLPDSPLRQLIAMCICEESKRASTQDLIQYIESLSLNSAAAAVDSSPVKN